MSKGRVRSNKKRPARRSRVAQIPQDLAAAIKRCWPRGVVEEFSIDESYFDEIRDHIERDLRNVSGASLVWQTERAGDASSDDDDPEEPPFQDFEWQSYHVSFVSPNGDEFRFEAATIGDDPEDPDSFRI